MGYIFKNMAIYKLYFFQNYGYVIIHRNTEIGIEYFLEKVLNFDFLPSQQVIRSV